MSRAIPQTEPEELIAGDSWWWDRYVPDYPPSAGWSLTYVLSGTHASAIQVPAAEADDGDYFKVRIAAADTADYTAGPYKLTAYASDGMDRFTVLEAQVVVRADLATAAPSVSHAERMLAAIEARLEGRLEADIEQYGIAGRSVMKIPAEQLLSMRNQYRAEVRQQRSPRSTFRKVAVSFVAPN